MLTAQQVVKAVKDIRAAKTALADNDRPTARELINDVEDVLVTAARDELDDHTQRVDTGRMLIAEYRREVERLRDAADAAGDPAALQQATDALASLPAEPPAPPDPALPVVPGA